MNKNVQQVYIYIDDSGVLHQNETCSVYGGIVFLNSKEREKFIKKYRFFLHSIRCKYCKKNVDTCHHNCPEIKDTNMYDNHKKRFMRLLDHEFCFAIIIKNQKVKKSILNEKSARGRFRDYTERILIKRILQKLIMDKKIDAYQPLELIIRIDKQVNILNIERNFLDDLVKEFTKGMNNMKYFIYYPPIIHSDFKIDLKYLNSKRHLLIQCADIIAGESRRHYLKGTLDHLTFLSLILYAP